MGKPSPDSNKLKLVSFLVNYLKDNDEISLVPAQDLVDAAGSKSLKSLKVLISREFPGILKSRKEGFEFNFSKYADPGQDNGRSKLTEQLDFLLEATKGRLEMENRTTPFIGGEGEMPRASLGRRR